MMPSQGSTLHYTILHYTILLLVYPRQNDFVPRSQNFQGIPCFFHQGEMDCSFQTKMEVCSHANTFLDCVLLYQECMVWLGPSLRGCSPQALNTISSSVVISWFVELICQ